MIFNDPSSRLYIYLSVAIATYSTVYSCCKHIMFSVLPMGMNSSIPCNSTSIWTSLIITNSDDEWRYLPMLIKYKSFAMTAWPVWHIRGFSWVFQGVISRRPKNHDLTVHICINYAILCSLQYIALYMDKAWSNHIISKQGFLFASGINSIGNLKSMLITKW